MKIDLKRRSKTILLSLLVMCLIFGSIEVKAQPIMWIDCTSSIKPGESIYVEVTFYFENTWQRLKSDIMVYYETSKGYSSSKEILISELRPESESTSISTYGLDLEDGDQIWITVVCDWGNLVSVQGTFEEYATVSVYESKSSTNGGSIRVGRLIVFIVGPISLVILFVGTIISLRRKKQKRLEKQYEEDDTFRKKISEGTRKQ